MLYIKMRRVNYGQTAQKFYRMEGQAVIEQQLEIYLEQQQELDELFHQGYLYELSKKPIFEKAAIKIRSFTRNAISAIKKGILPEKPLPF